MPGVSVEVAPPGPAVPADQAPALVSQPLRHLANRSLKPLPETPLSLQTKCRYRDVTGYRGELDLKVVSSRVERFASMTTIPRRGECRFDLADFQQLSEGPSVALVHTRQENCRVRIWSQGRQVTVAFHECPQLCSGDSFEYLWPVLVDTRTGRCS